MVDTEKEVTESRSSHEEKEEKTHGGPQHPVRAIQATLTAAGEAPNPWGSGHRKLYLACLLIYLCSTMNGEAASNPRLYLPPRVLTSASRLRWLSDGLH